VSSGLTLGMRDSLSYVICHFAPYQLVHLMYEKRTASIQKSKVHPIIQCTFWPVKYSSILQ